MSELWDVLKPAPSLPGSSKFRYIEMSDVNKGGTLEMLFVQGTQVGE